MIEMLQYELRREHDCFQPTHVRLLPTLAFPPHAVFRHLSQDSRAVPRGVRDAIHGPLLCILQLVQQVRSSVSGGFDEASGGSASGEVA